MKPSVQPINLDRCVLAGLFTGIVAALVAVVFDVIYRNATGLYDYGLAMPVSLFMVFPFLNLIAGGIYYLFLNQLRRGAALFIFLMLLCMLVLALFTAYSGSKGTHSKHEFRDLIIGMEIIQGILGAVLIPFFVNHPTLYLTSNDIRGEE
jgi:hypothetical protein